MRRHERLQGKETVIVSFDNEHHIFVTADVSVGGMRLLGNVHAPLGTRVSVQLGHAHFEGTIVRRSESEFAVSLDENVSNRTAMVRKVYSGEYKGQISNVKPGTVARKVIGRLMK
jgi:cellulose synthase (UDP-forming)